MRPAAELVEFGGVVGVEDADEGSLLRGGCHLEPVGREADGGEAGGVRLKLQDHVLERKRKYSFKVTSNWVYKKMHFSTKCETEKEE